jgi:MFS family permease
MNLSSLRRYSELWYSGYAFQGAVVFGTGAILMPIIVNHSGDAAKAGMVMGCFYIGQMLSPLMGAIIDRTGWHRSFYISGFILLAIGLAVFPLTKLVWFWMGLAFIQGVGSGTSNTVAAMFIVEYKPKQEWDPRVGWLQTFYGVGQAVGLGMASVLQARPEMGLLISAALMAPALILGTRHLPLSSVLKKPAKVEFSRLSHRPPRSVHSFLHHYEGTVQSSLKHMLHEFRSAFGLFMAGWFFVQLTTWLIGALFPLLMKSAFDISYGRSSLYYMIGAIIGIFCYVPSAMLGKKLGNGWAVVIGTIMTVISTGAMAMLAHSGHDPWLVPFVYVLIPIAWSPLIVGGTAWTAQLATFKEGEALGCFNAITAVAAVIAAFAAGLIAKKFGYSMVLTVGTISSIVALVCFLPLLRSAQKRN